MKRIKTVKKPIQLIHWLLVLPVILSIVGVFFIFEASAVKSFSDLGNSFYYLKQQLIWLVIGIVIALAVSTFDYHRFYYLAFFLMGGTVFLLMLVLVPGIGAEVGGARRWIDLGFFRLQPTELAKLATIIYLSAWFINRERKRFFSFLILLGVLMVLVFLQPDMGTAAIIFLVGLTIYYLAGVELHYLLFLIPTAAVLAGLLIKFSPYRFHRLLAFFDPNLDPLGITYHINQILISLSNGGWLGQGFGASRQKYLFLPEAHTDSIFAIVGEEIGFVGSTFLLLGFIFLMYKIYQVAQRAPDRFGRLLAGGAFAFFNFQILINLGGMVNLIPLTGVPLPFISYGGSNLLVSFFLLGMLINIAKKSKVGS
ncbi:putative lipid II flippase FtsW [Patescibacteria group bacterium]|nr:putative lipid II flippase FtsW [Patescibacteria group bacterium]MCL5091774.1 putative lipid II flippase FtsW [Patescibacteria group bacterium]